MILTEKQFYNIEPNKLIFHICNMTCNINNNYVYELLSNENNSILFYSFDNSTTDVANCPCCLIYKIQMKEDQVNVFIMFLATTYKFRKYGYAAIFLNEFINFILDKYNALSNINIILDSVETSVCFYEKLGFKWTDTNEYHTDLGIEDELEHFILVHKIK
jgi:hypothetical protein